ncbi:hypothetical protein ACFVUY_42875 [Kitasatospora sp. NPDC058063]|uniref:hypothetical protein n=1 Tax=unclassified Kitasatospora TaxID=2633591 RepID=UPI00337F08B6
MVGVLVVIEQPQQPDLLVVHAAGSDPDVPGDPLPVTACGIETASMVVDPWRPSGPGSRWYPPRYAGHVCPRCERAVRSM